MNTFRNDNEALSRKFSKNRVFAAFVFIVTTSLFKKTCSLKSVNIDEKTEKKCNALACSCTLNKHIF